MEIWKDYIAGYYQASNLGNIRSVDRVVKFNGTPAIRKGIQLQPTINSKGYLTVVICVNGKRSTQYVHRIIATTFHAKPADKTEVNHKNGKVLENQESNLEWVTRSENLEHAVENGLITTGNVKLTQHEVSEIKLLIYEGLSNPAIGHQFGVDKATIRNIRIGKSWTHVKMASREPENNGQ